MFCANCGTKQNEGEKFCPNCGTRFEEPKIVKEDVSVDTSKQALPKNGKIDLLKEITEETKGEVKNVEITDMDSSVISFTQNEIVNAIQTKNEVIKLNDPIVVESKVETAIENPDTKEQNITEAKNIKVSQEEVASPSENVTLVDVKTENVKQGITKSNDSIMEVESKEEAAIDVLDEEIKRLMKAAENGDKDAILRLAIKYEFGLGVNVNIDESEKYYKPLEDGDILTNNLMDIDIGHCYEHGNGILDYKYKVDPEIYFNNRVKTLRTDKEKGFIYFKYYLEYSSEFEVKGGLKDKIYNYNHYVSGYYSEVKINYKTNYYYLIEGIFQKRYTNIIGFKSLLINSKYKEFEKEVEKMFLDICDLCETLKLR